MAHDGGFTATAALQIGRHGRLQGGALRTISAPTADSGRIRCEPGSVRELPRNEHGECARSDDQEVRGTDDRGGAPHNAYEMRTFAYRTRSLGKLIPNVFAVFTFNAKTYLALCSTGRSAG